MNMKLNFLVVFLTLLTSYSCDKSITYVNYGDDIDVELSYSENIEDNFDKQTLESIFENLMNQHDLSLGKLMQPIRFALSGLTYGPGIFDTMLLLGKDTCVKRLSESMKELS